MNVIMDHSKEDVSYVEDKELVVFKIIILKYLLDAYYCKECV